MPAIFNWQRCEGMEHLLTEPLFSVGLAIASIPLTPLKLLRTTAVVNYPSYKRIIGQKHVGIFQKHGSNFGCLEC